MSCPTHRESPDRPSERSSYPSSSITDAQWAVLEPLLPPPGNTTGNGGRPEKHPRRLVLDAIFYVVRGGIAWRQMPHDFPPATTVYDIFRRWTKNVVWHKIHDTLRDLVRVRAGRDPLPTAAIVDSQTVRGADTVPSDSAGYDAGKKTKGRKRHIATDTLGLLLAVVVTGAHIQDRDGAHRLLVALRARFSTVSHLWVDGGYAGRLVLWAHKVLSLTLEVVKRTDKTSGFLVLPRRWVVERTFGWITKHRRCVRDYETLPEHHEAMVYIAMIMTMSRRLARAGDH
ncbi:IS5 family transposase [Nocardia sp. NPDC049220]|uniref:IS5 family transposase n=1 Tax=Nocardia sp. NPDC049220 TaxID=3155273 RepID=UPI0033CAE8AE